MKKEEAMKLRKIIKLVGAGYTIYNLVKGSKRAKYSSTSGFGSSRKSSKFSKATKYYKVAKTLAKVLK